jgi:hypothetical protein
MAYWYKYRLKREFSPQEEYELLSDIDSMRGLGAVTYDTRTNRLVEFEIDSFSAWRIELAKALLKESPDGIQGNQAG